MWKIEPKGRGLFAACLILKGTIILVEKALALTKKEHRNPDSKSANDMAMRELENKC